MPCFRADKDSSNFFVLSGLLINQHLRNVSYIMEAQCQLIKCGHDSERSCK